MKKTTNDVAADVRTSSSAAPLQPATAELLEDTPDQVKADLRKFNRTEAIVQACVRELTGFAPVASHEDVARAQEELKTAAAIEKTVEKKRLELSKPYRDQAERINDYAKALLQPVRPAIEVLKGRILAFQKSEADRIQKLQNDSRHAMLIDMGLVFFDKGRPEVRSAHYNDPSTGRNIYRADLESVSGPVWAELVQAVLRAREELREAKARELTEKIEGAEFFGQDASEIREQLQQVKEAPAITSIGPEAGIILGAKVQGLTRRWKFEITDPNQVPRAYCTPDEKLIRQEVAAGARNIPGVRIYEEESISIR